MKVHTFCFSFGVVSSFIIFLVDDPLDAFAVHFGGGFSGMVSAPLLVTNGVILVGDVNSAEVMEIRIYNFAGPILIVLSN